jgi:hypothetical protein
MKGWLDKYENGGGKKKPVPNLNDAYTKLGISAKNFIDPMSNAVAVSDAYRAPKVSAKPFEINREQLSDASNKNKALSDFYKRRYEHNKNVREIAQTFQNVGAATEALSLIPTPITETIGMIGGAANLVGSSIGAIQNANEGNYLDAAGDLLMGATALPSAKLFNIKSVEGLKNLSKSKTLKEAIGASFANITPTSALPRMTPQELKIARGVQDIGRLRAMGAPQSKQIQKALDINLPEDQFRNTFGISRNDAIATVTSPAPVPSIADDVRASENDLMYALFGRRSTNTDRERLRQIFEDINQPTRVEPNIAGADLDVDNIEIPQSFRDRLDAHVARRSQEIVPPDVYAEQRIRLEAAQQRLEDARRRSQASQTQSYSDQVIDHMNEELDLVDYNYRPSYRYSTPSNNGARENLRKYIENSTRDFMQPYKKYEGPVSNRLSLLEMDESGLLGAKRAISAALDESRLYDSLGDVVTGSTNTSHSSYLPQLKTIFGEARSLGDPVFLGNKSMNSMGFLSNFGYSREDVARYMNSEIDQLIKRGKVPEDIMRPTYSPVTGDVMLPHYGIKKTTESKLNKSLKRAKDLPDLPFENGGELNYNDYSVSASPDFVGDGYSNRGRNYSPAWGGQFAMGGSMPGAVGFMYARTNDPAPSEGPYAKKTLPSAQNGTEMRYYQEGLDFRPKTISRDGSQLVKLDQLTNFTNYNTKQPGGWLDKYEG